MCFTCAITPTNLMNSTIMSLLKNKARNITDPDNYRSFALSSRCSKVFESIILDRYDQCFSTFGHQFRFKKPYITHFRVYAFKNIVKIELLAFIS